MAKKTKHGTVIKFGLQEVYSFEHTEKSRIEEEWSSLETFCSKIASGSYKV